MGVIGKFDTDTAALTKRLEAHERFSSLDLNEWCFGLLGVSPGIEILELGCGTGKQTLPLARLVGRRGRVTALDISQEALDVLRQQALESGLGGNIVIRRADLDEVPSSLQPEPVDRVIACYSIYYAKRPEPLFQFLHAALRPGGILFFCGPAQLNNRELKDFHDSLYARLNRPVPSKKSAAPFMEVTGPDLARAIFGNAEIAHFENPLRFDSPEALHSYWSSYNLYDESLDEIFRARASEHFAHAGVFETVKRVIGVRAVKPS
jgi:SAM-dependent methyltransferase